MCKTLGLPYCSSDRLCFPTNSVHFRRGKSLPLAYSGSRPENVMVSQRLSVVTPICALSNEIATLANQNILLKTFFNDESLHPGRRAAHNPPFVIKVAIGTLSGPAIDDRQTSPQDDKYTSALGAERILYRYFNVLKCHICSSGRWRLNWTYQQTRKSTLQ